MSDENDLIARWDGFSWSGYQRSWKSDAIWVDLKPVRKRVESIQRYRQGKSDQMRAYNAVGECAAALLLGGTVNTKDKTGPDISLPSGEEFVVRTSFWGGGTKYQPTMTSAKQHLGRQKDLPAIWCVTRRFPDCYDGAWVVGVMGRAKFYETRMEGAGKFSWAWMNRWVDDGRFQRIEEIMEDEIDFPTLRVGMPYRRTPEDIGIPEYLESYGFLGASEEADHRYRHEGDDQSGGETRL